MKNAPGSLIIHNGWLIDGTGAAPVPNGTLHIVDG
jgi:hypothetical protein